MHTILVVDDEQDVLNALGRALRIGGYAVSTASTAEGALALCQDHSFDVVLLDYVMPSMLGIELLNRIRKYQPSVRSIIVSGKMDLQVGEESLGAELREKIEADVYLHKPIDNPRLLQTIADLVSKDGTLTWKEIASRNLSEEKPKKSVKKAENALRRFRRRPKP